MTTEPEFILLDREEFRDQLETLGYGRNVSARVFGILVRESMRQTRGRNISANELAYFDVDGVKGLAGCVVSVPAVREQLDFLPGLPYVGDLGYMACKDLTNALLGPEIHST